MGDQSGVSIATSWRAPSPAGHCQDALCWNECGTHAGASQQLSEPLKSSIVLSCGPPCEMDNTHGEKCTRKCDTIRRLNIPHPRCHPLRLPHSSSSWISSDSFLIFGQIKSLAGGCANCQPGRNCAVIIDAAWDVRVTWSSGGPMDGARLPQSNLGKSF